ncbi:MAG: ABC transporter substrate-binding protein [Candidatus Thermoplasmatota archaeon]|nr:ABC transporter substrate-binding protein [Candidatus Thermoplasmatota archaeon]
MAQGTSTVIIVVIAAVVIVGGLSVGLLVVAPALQGVEDPSGIRIVDDYGRNVTVPQPVERIISLAPSNTEILFALGLDDKVVGVDQASDYPPEAQDKTVVGGYFGGYNLEVITVLDPQLILASSINSEQLIGDLENRSFAVVVLDASDIDGVFDDIELVGSITDADAEAEGLISNLTTRVETITNLTHGVETPSVYIELDNNLWTYGPGSFGDDLLGLAGGENIAGSMGYPWVKLDEEFVVTSSPDIIITVFTPVEEIKSRPGWSDIPAIQNDKVFAVDGDLISRPGPRIVDGLEELAHLIHPELFP